MKRCEHRRCQPFIRRTFFGRQGVESADNAAARVIYHSARGQTSTGFVESMIQAK
jgi:hypothetical protein